jgi:hypothetical protein
MFHRAQSVPGVAFLDRRKVLARRRYERQRATAVAGPTDANATLRIVNIGGRPVLFRTSDGGWIEPAGANRHARLAR